MQRDFEDAVSSKTSEFENSVKVKASDFEGSVQQYRKMLEDSSKRNNELFTQLVSAIRDSSSNTKEEGE